MNPAVGVAVRFKSVIFDFDYTLADSSVGVIDCINYALDTMGLPVAGADRIRSLIGVSLSETFEELSGRRGDTRFEEFKRLFTERADLVMLDGVRLFDPVRQVVNALLAGGVTLGIVSTKFRYRIEDVLRRDRLEHVFQVIVGGEDVAEHKPDPTGLQMAIAKLERAASEVLYVGDSAVDAETALRAGVTFVAVLSGVTRPQTLGAYRPLGVIGSLVELPALVLARRTVEGAPS
jgi:phosphoglycolate phosphatase